MEEELRKSTEVIYTDGSCLRNGQHDNTPQSGIGVYWPDNESNNISEPILEGRQTNNRAEIMAVSRGITQAKEQGYRNLLIKLDSKYVIDGIKRSSYYDTIGWKGLANVDEFQQLRRSMRGMNIEFEHVSSKDNQAHKLAFKAAQGVEIIKKIVRRAKTLKPI